jgi:hypothetical protein
MNPCLAAASLFVVVASPLLYLHVNHLRLDRKKRSSTQNPLDAFKALTDEVKNQSENTRRQISQLQQDTDNFRRDFSNLMLSLRILNAAEKRRQAAADVQEGERKRVREFRAKQSEPDPNPSPPRSPAACGLIAPGALGLPQDRNRK